MENKDDNLIPDVESLFERSLNLYKSAITENKGRILFLAGETGSGQNTILNEIAVKFAEIDNPPKIFTGFFRNNLYEIYPPEEKIKVQKILLAVGGLIGTVAKMMNPAVGLVADATLIGTGIFADFLGQVLTTGADCQDLVEEFIKRPPNAAEAPFWLEKLLYRAAKNRPLVWLVSDFDQAEGGIWSNFLWEFAPHMSEDLPMLFIAALNGKKELGTIEKSDPQLKKSIGRVLEDKRAEWHFIEPLTKVQVKQLLGPTDLGMVAQIHVVTGGKYGLVSELWEKLRSEEFVIWSEEKNCWIWSLNKTRSLNLYDGILYDRLRKLFNTSKNEDLAAARKILAVGALEGVTFTSRTLESVFTWDKDKMIDFLDVLADENNSNQLLSEELELKINNLSGKPRSLWRYTLLSEFFRPPLLQYELNDAEKVTLRVSTANALINAYSPEEWRVARRIAELFREASEFNQFKQLLDKDQQKRILDQTEKYQDLADNLWINSRESLREYAEGLLKINTNDWDKFRLYHSAKILFQAGSAMFHHYPYTEVVKVFEKSLKLAKAADEPEIEVDTINRAGVCYASLGELEKSKSYALQGLSLSKTIDYKFGRMESLLLLGKIAHIEKKYKKARKKFKQALSVSKIIKHRQAEAETFRQLGQIYFEQSKTEEALAHFNEALEIFKEIEDIYGNKGEAECLYAIGFMDYHKGNYKQSREKAEQALAIFEETENDAGESLVFHLLGRIACNENNYILACEYIERSFRIDQSLKYKEGEATGLNTLGVIAHRIGKLPEALQFFLTSRQLSLLNKPIQAEQDSNISDILSKLNYSPAQIMQKAKEAIDEYYDDKGDGLIERAFAHLTHDPDDLPAHENHSALDIQDTNSSISNE